jgi:hypothetical protein
MVRIHPLQVICNKIDSRNPNRKLTGSSLTVTNIDKLPKGSSIQLYSGPHKQSQNQHNRKPEDDDAVDPENLDDGAGQASDANDEAAVGANPAGHGATDGHVPGDTLSQRARRGPRRYGTLALRSEQGHRVPAAGGQNLSQTPLQEQREAQSQRRPDRQGPLDQNIPATGTTLGDTVLQREDDRSQDVTRPRVTAGLGGIVLKKGLSFELLYGEFLVD